MYAQSCKVSECSLMTKDCMTEANSKNVILGGVGSGFSMSGLTTIEEGYQEELCMRCTIQDGLGPHVYDYPLIEVVGHPKEEEEKKSSEQSNKPPPLEAF